MNNALLTALAALCYPLIFLCSVLKEVCSVVVTTMDQLTKYRYYVWARQQPGKRWYISGKYKTLPAARRRLRWLKQRHYDIKLDDRIETAKGQASRMMEAHRKAAHNVKKVDPSRQGSSKI